MATVTGFTAERMLEIEDNTIVGAEVRGGHLILIKHDGSEVDVGSIAGPSGPVGPAGPPGLSSIPGEVKLWPGSALPDEATYGKWVWADGAYYPVATYPLAAAHIAAAWKTFDGASDPGVSNFRVPDLRGLVAAGLDQMPEGTRANRMTRAAAIVMAARTGKETHQLSISEMPTHTHTYSGGHLHSAVGGGNKFLTTVNVGEGFYGNLNAGPQGTANDAWKAGATSYADASALNPAGGGIAHENVQPTVFVPYIVCLDS